MDSNTARNDGSGTPLNSDLLSSMQRFSELQSSAQEPPAFVVYKVKAGDTLGTVIAKRYGVLYKDPRYDEAQATILHFNPAIKNKDLIYAGQLIRLHPIGAESKVRLADSTASGNERKPPSSVNDNAPTQEQTARAEEQKRSRREELAKNFTHHGSSALPNNHTLDFHTPIAPDEEEAMWMLAWLMENYYSPASIAAGAGLNSFGALVSPANNQYLKDMKIIFEQRKRGEISKNHYGKRMKAVRLAYMKKIGPFDKMLFKGQTITEATYIRNTRALPASTVKIKHHLSRLERMGRLASRGGVVLTAAGVGVGCYDIGRAETRQQKNKIFVETFMSTLVGVATSTALGVLFFSTPVGWGAALVLGSTAALGSWGAGRGASEIYTMTGSKIDFVSAAGVDHLCR